MTGSVFVTNPYAKIEFVTEEGNFEIEQSLSGVNAKDVDLDVLSIQTSRDIGADDCATFSITLIFRKEWYESVRSNDLVIINLGRGKKLDPVFFGLVDSVSIGTSYIDLKPARSITVSGRGFNKALLQFDVGAVQEIEGGVNSIFGFYENQNIIVGQHSPAQLIDFTLKYFLKKGMDFSFANGKNWKDYLNTIFQDDGEKVAITNATNYYSYQGSLWNYLKELRNAPFYEGYWEVIDGRPSFIVRPTPFNQDKWEALERFDINDDYEILDENLGINDLETYTVYVVKGEGIMQALNDTFNAIPVWYKPFYKKYGLRRLECMSKYAYEGILSGTEINEKTKDIFNWNIKNPIMENGSISFVGRSDFKIGTRLYIKKFDKEYYIEKVLHNFTYGEGWTTKLEVTRGIKPEERFTSPWGEYAKITSDDIFELMGEPGSRMLRSSDADAEAGLDGDYFTNIEISGGRARIGAIAKSHAGEKYDQLTRMNDGVSDCSSFVYKVAMEAQNRDWHGTYAPATGSMLNPEWNFLWEQIPLSQAKPWDILLRDGHTEFLGDDERTYGAHYWGVPSGPGSKYYPSNWTWALRIKGIN